jgi:hypothetical protein
MQASQRTNALTQPLQIPLTPTNPRSTVLLPPDVGPRSSPKGNRFPTQSQGDHMRHVLAAVLCIAIPIAMFASEKDNGYKVTYDGGSLPGARPEPA